MSRESRVESLELRVKSRALVSLLVFQLSAFSLQLSAFGSDGAPPPAIVGVRVGFDGCYKPGLWTPVEVMLRGDLPPAAELTITVPDGDGIPSRVSAPLMGRGGEGSGFRVQGLGRAESRESRVEGRDVSNASPSTHNVDAVPPDAAGGLRPSRATSHPSPLTPHPSLLYVRFGRVRSELTVELREGAKLLAKRVFRAGEAFPQAIASERRVFLAVAPKSMGIEETVGVLGQASRGKATVVRLEDCNQLPTQWYGYEGIDTVFLSTSRPEIYAGLGPTSSLVVALDEWVQMGGRLVFCVGSQAEDVLRPGDPLAAFAPGKLDRMVTLRQAGALEAYAGSARNISSTAAARLQFRVPLLADVDGKVEAWDGKLPLVVRRAHGFGEIVFLASDLDLPPLAAWPDRGQLVAKLFGGASTGGEERDDSAAIMHYGYTDLAGQLRSSLDRFEGVRPVPFSLVVGLVVLYVLVIGPGDYFFLRKIVGRMELTWITFPLSVLVVAAAAYLLAGRFKSDRLRVNEVSLVDVDTASGRLRGTSWANIFSPKMDRYDVTFQPSLPGGQGLAQAGMLCAWLGLPGSGLGGMDPKTTEPEVWKGRYEFAPRLDGLVGVPIPIWSTRSVTARWSAHAEVYPKAELVEQDQLPVGRITNTLAFPLQESLLAYGRWAYPLGTIEPGGSVEVGPTLARRELRTLLTGQRMVYDETSKRFAQQFTPYDLASTDPVYVLRAMAFFDAAGGRRYTGLVNRYQGFVDLSHLLQTNRAVLMALGPADGRAHGARLVCDDRPVAADGNRHATVLRFVFPVTAEE